MEAILAKLSEAWGVSGNEGEVRNLIRGEIAPFVHELKIDVLGNLIAVKRGTGRGPRVMLAAHMDEVGLMVSYIEKSGLLRFRKVGGIDERVLPGKRVVVGKGKVPGVIGAKPIHLVEPKELESPIKIEQLFIDIGAKSKEEAEKVVKLGDYVAFDTKFSSFGAGLVKGKALDDRVGCTVLIETLKKDWELELIAVFTAQEEVGLRGVTVAAYDVAPEMALVVEGTICSDTPGSEEHGQGTLLGAGPAVSVMDAASIPNKAMVKELISLAEQNNIPVQFRRTTMGANDAGRIHVTRQGVPTASLSVPCRYIHSPASVASLSDLENTARLVELFLKRIETGGFKL